MLCGDCGDVKWKEHRVLVPLIDKEVCYSEAYSLTWYQRDYLIHCASKDENLYWLYQGTNSDI